MKTLKRYYSDDLREEVLELHDNRTLWKVDNENLQEDEYTFSVECIIDEFKELTGEDLLLCGRSSRHCCVADTKKNQLHFHRYKKIALELEKELIDHLNNYGKE